MIFTQDVPHFLPLELSEYQQHFAARVGAFDPGPWLQQWRWDTWQLLPEQAQSLRVAQSLGATEKFFTVDYIMTQKNAEWDATGNTDGFDRAVNTTDWTTNDPPTSAHPGFRP